MAPLRRPYKSVSDTPIPTDIYLPTLNPHPPNPSPVLIMIHGGGFMLGHSGLNNADQIQDCTDRGWIVVAIEHRLCPGVDVLEGPMADVRDAVAWVQGGGLADALDENLPKPKPKAEGEAEAEAEIEREVQVDSARVMIMGTSSGGHLALSTAWTCPVPPLAILDFYGAKGFTDPFWTTPIPHMPEAFYAPLAQADKDAVLAEKTIFIGGTSLEGQPADPTHPNPQQRQGYAMHHIATGNVLRAIWPRYPADLGLIDPVLNVSSSWPPTAIVHGLEDGMIPIRLSRGLEGRLREVGVRTELFEVEGEGHTFAGKMVKGGKTWESQRRGFDWLAERLAESY